MFLLATFLFGIEELAVRSPSPQPPHDPPRPPRDLPLTSLRSRSGQVQLEEPFSILPLDKLCGGVQEVADDLAASPAQSE